MTDRTPTTALDAAWEALHVDLTNAWQNEGPTYYENILARHRPLIETEARAEARAEALRDVREAVNAFGFALIESAVSGALYEYDVDREAARYVMDELRAALLRAALVAPETLGVERIAAFLHDEYGCRITCRGGRLADDRHPSHNEAYLDQAGRLRAALEEPTP
jgi:hypothetical protein